VARKRKETAEPVQLTLWNDRGTESRTVHKDLPGALPPVDIHRTGVGTPDNQAEAGGMELGGDTGDVGTPRDQLGGSPGGTYGTPSTPPGEMPQRGETPPPTKKRRGKAA